MLKKEAKKKQKSDKETKINQNSNRNFLKFKTRP